MKFYQRFTWKFLKCTYGIYMKRKYRIKCVRKSPEPKPPYILIANHFYFTDGFHIGKFLKHPVHYIGSDEYTSFFQGFLDRSVGIIYIEKGKMETKNILNISKTLKEGGSVGIFPEADGSWDGETVDFSQKMIKILKLFSVPVVTVRINGGYFTKPRWSKVFRRGKIILEFDNISLDEIKNSSVEELYRTVKSKIYSNELRNPLVNNIEYKCKNTSDGIHNLLWKCPSCNSEDTIRGIKNKIICAECKAEWSLSGNFRVLPVIKNISDLKDWSEWQKSEIKNKIMKTRNDNDILTASRGVGLEVYSKTVKTLFRDKLVFSEAGEGDLTLTKSRLTVKLYGSTEMSFDVKDIKYFVECLNKYFKFYYHDKPYKIIFNSRNSARYLQFFQELQKN